MFWNQSLWTEIKINVYQKNGNRKEQRMKRTAHDPKHITSYVKSCPYGGSVTAWACLAADGTGETGVY